MLSVSRTSYISAVRYSGSIGNQYKNQEEKNEK